MNIRRWIRSGIERSPALAAALRSARDEWEWHTRSASSTPLGFRFSGNDSMQKGQFEPEETAMLLSRIDDFDVLVDVGANIGYYTCLALNAGKQVVAFEPLPNNLRLLYQNLDDNGWRNVEIWPIGLSKEPGLLFLYGATTGASLVPGWASVSESFRRIVPVNTLDNVMAHRFLDKRLLIKVDVEGAEFEVLMGATAMLRRKPLWLMEIALTQHREKPNPHFLETFELFWSHGYNAFSADRTGTPISRKEIERRARAGSWDVRYNWLFTSAP